MTNTPLLTQAKAPITYLVLDKTTNASKGALAANVVGEPDFTDSINSGWNELQLTVDTKPNLINNLVYFDMITVYMNDPSFVGPTGDLAIGRWKYEKYSASEHETNKWILHCLPLSAELGEVDYEANFTNVTDQDLLPGLGPATFDVPVRQAVPRTRHCYVVTANNDGNAYYMQFKRRTGRVQDTLNRAIDMGGPDWWWYVDGFGRITLQTGPRVTHSLDYNNDIIWQDHGGDAAATINVLTVIGGSHTVTVTDPATGLTYPASVPIETRVENDDPAHPYSTVNVGRRVGTPWRDIGVADGATAVQLGNSLLLRHGYPIQERTLLVRPGWGYIQSGDKVNVTFPDEPTITGFWVKQRTYKGSTGMQQIVIASAIEFHERPFRARMGSLRGLESTLLNQIPLGGAGSGGSCGGYIPLARTLPGSTSYAWAGSGTSAPVSTFFVLDSGGQCQIDIRACGSIKLAPTGAGGACTIQLMCDLGTADGAVIKSAQVAFPSDGNDHPFALFAPSGAAMADGTYTLWLAVRGPASNVTLIYDLQAFLYSGGSAA